MTIEVNELGNTVLRADNGMALCPFVEEGPSLTTIVYLAKGASQSAWNDCEYGETTEATEADKDAALETLGVDMTEG